MDVTEDIPMDMQQQTLVPDAELPIYNEIMEQVQQENEQLWKRRVSKYMRDGMTEDDAADKANKKMEDADMALFIKKYSRLLLDILQLNKGILHQKIVQMIDKNIQKKYNEQKAVKLALKQFQDEIQDMMPEKETDSENDTEHEDDENDEVNVI